MRSYKEGIDKAVHDSEVILHSVLRDLMNLDSPAGFLKSNEIIGEFKSRMLVWSKFEKGEVGNVKG